MEEQTQATHVLVPAPLYEALWGILKRLPWEEVNGIMATLSRCPKVKPQQEESIDDGFRE